MSEFGSEVTCPHCAKSMDSYELYMENGAQANDGASACLYCGEDVADDEWITD